MVAGFKQYKVNKRWGINCITHNSMYGKYFDVEVIMLDVPWQEVVECERGTKDPSVANQVFKGYVSKYKQLDY